MKPILVQDLPENLKQKALNAFNELADNQRDLPERMGGGGPLNSNPGKLHATGIWLLLTEHVGDLTHRMAQKRCENINYGAEMIVEKCDRACGYLGARYAIGRDIDEQVKNNWHYATDVVHKTDITLEEWRAQWIESGERYAMAHSKLVVYNSAQHSARQAAIAVGLRQYDTAFRYCDWLREKAKSAEWKNYAGSVIFDNSENLLTFDQWPSEYK